MGASSGLSWRLAGGPTKAVEHHARRHSDVGRQVARHGAALQRVRDALHRRQQKLKHRNQAFPGMDVVLLPRTVRQPVEIALGALQPLLVGRGAALLAVFVGIEIAVQFHNARVHAFFEQQIDGALGGVGARRIGIEIDNDPLRVALERLDLLRRQRRAAACHHRREAGRGDADRIHIAFHQNYAVFLANRLLCTMQVVKHAALLIYRRFRRI